MALRSERDRFIGFIDPYRTYIGKNIWNKGFSVRLRKSGNNIYLEVRYLHEASMSNGGYIEITIDDKDSITLSRPMRISTRMNEGLHKGFWDNKLRRFGITKFQMPYRLSEEQLEMLASAERSILFKFEHLSSDKFINRDYYENSIDSPAATGEKGYTVIELSDEVELALFKSFYEKQVE